MKTKKIKSMIISLSLFASTALYGLESFSLSPNAIKIINEIEIHDTTNLIRLVCYDPTTANIMVLEQIHNDCTIDSEYAKHPKVKKILCNGDNLSYRFKETAILTYIQSWFSSKIPMKATVGRFSRANSSIIFYDYTPEQRQSFAEKILRENQKPYKNGSGNLDSYFELGEGTNSVHIHFDSDSGSEAQQPKRLRLNYNRQGPSGALDYYDGSTNIFFGCFEAEVVPGPSPQDYVPEASGNDASEVDTIN